VPLLFRYPPGVAAAAAAAAATAAVAATDSQAPFYFCVRTMRQRCLHSVAMSGDLSPILDYFSKPMETKNGL